MTNVDTMTPEQELETKITNLNWFADEAASFAKMYGLHSNAGIAKATEADGWRYKANQLQKELDELRNKNKKYVIMEKEIFEILKKMQSSSITLEEAQKQLLVLLGDTNKNAKLSQSFIDKIDSIESYKTDSMDEL